MNIDQLIKTTSKYDTPTMCNAMDVILGTRSAIGFTKSSMVTAQNSTQPIVGFAKTAKIRAHSYLKKKLTISVWNITSTSSKMKKTL